MRVQLLGIILAALCFAPISGCDDDSGNKVMDLSVNHDLTIEHDLRGAGTENCSAILQCAQGCTTPATAATCVATCETAGTASAQTLFGAIGTCAYTACIGASDLGADTHACSSATDTSAGCTKCISDEATKTNDCLAQEGACLAQP